MLYLFTYLAYLQVYRSTPTRPRNNRRQIKNLARNYINHITKLEFLPAFKAAFYDAFIKNNIYGSF